MPQMIQGRQLRGGERVRFKRDILMGSSGQHWTIPAGTTATVCQLESLGVRLPDGRFAHAEAHNLELLS